MGEALALVIVLAAGGATLSALLTLLPYLLRRPVVRIAAIIQKTPGRVLLVGLINFIFFSLVAVVLSQVGEALPGIFGGLFTLAALTIVWLLLALALAGLAGVVRVLCSRLWLVPERGPDSTQPGQHLPGRTGRAALLLVAALLAPVAGWFLLAPPLLLAALGASIIALFQWAQPGRKAG